MSAIQNAENFGFTGAPARAHGLQRLGVFGSFSSSGAKWRRARAVGMVRAYHFVVRETYIICWCPVNIMDLLLAREKLHLIKDEVQKWHWNLWPKSHMYDFKAKMREIGTRCFPSCRIFLYWCEKMMKPMNEDIYMYSLCDKKILI